MNPKTTHIIFYIKICLFVCDVVCIIFGIVFLSQIITRHNELFYLLYEDDSYRYYYISINSRDNPTIIYIEPKQ